MCSGGCGGGSSYSGSFKSNIKATKKERIYFPDDIDQAIIGNGIYVFNKVSYTISQRGNKPSISVAKHVAEALVKRKRFTRDGSTSPPVEMT